eukprot:3487216-Alexandrium_andersonii.AAC.1
MSGRPMQQGRCWPKIWCHICKLHTRVGSAVCCGCAQTVPRCRCEQLRLVEAESEPARLSTT